MEVSAVNLNQTSFQAKNKKSNLGAKIGAVAGLTISSGTYYFAQKNIDKVVKKVVTKENLSKLQSKKISAVLKNTPTKAAALVGIVVATGIGALLGKGVQKLVNNFSNHSKVYKDTGAIFCPKPIKGKDGMEYVVMGGHPKTVYRKNPETGKLELITQVYDGSWGKELSDKDLIKTITTKV